MPDEIHVVVSGATATFRLTETVTLGRAGTNDIVVDDGYVSGAHLELRRTPAGWEAVDVGSTNGTFIEGRQVQRADLGPHTTIRLGHPAGPEVVVMVQQETPPEATLVVPQAELASRYLGEAEPEDMSERTRVVRATLQHHREQETRVWLKRTRQMRVVVLALLVFGAGAAGLAWLQGRRVEAQRRTAAELFYTMKALELDLRRLEATAGSDSSARERQQRLEDQYEDLLTTLGIYSDRTPQEVQLIYRTIHRLGESEVTVPREFVDEVLRFIGEWNPADLEAGLGRAAAGDLAPTVGDILLGHGLPREFLFLALQESKLDPDAIGPSTPYGVPKGMWQMIPATAEAYGLRLGPLQGERQVDPADERHDVEKATAAAARYLADIYETDAQASGLLVMAAYNLGEPRLLGMVRSMPESPRDRNFWSLLENHGDQIPEETYNYVYRIVSAAVIGQDPQLFGFTFEPAFDDAPATDAPPARD